MGAHRLAWPTSLAEGRPLYRNPAEVAQSLSNMRFAADATGRRLPGQDAPLNSVGSWSFILARPDLPDDVGYRLIKLSTGEASAGRLEQQETTAANTAAAAPDPALIQSAVARYLRGWGL